MSDKSIEMMRRRHTLQLLTAAENSNLTADEVLQELRIQQTELELQNEELRGVHLNLEQSRDHSTDLYELAPIGYLTLSNNGKITEINLTDASLFGKAQQDFDNDYFVNFVDSKDRDRWYHHFELAKRTNQKQRLTLSLERTDGKPFHAILDCVPIQTDTTPWMLRVTLTDITDHHALPSRDEAYHSILAATLDGFLTIDPQGKLLDTNNRYSELSGYTCEELLGMSIIELEAIENPAYNKAHFQKIIKKGGDQFETVHRRKNGSIWHVEISITYLDSNGGIFFLWLRDISERKQAEVNLRIASTAFESQDGLIITDANGIILKVNKAFTDMTGYSAEEVVGLTPLLIKSGYHDVDFYTQMWKTIKKNGSWQGEIWDRHKNGDVYPKWLIITAVKDKEGVVTHYVGRHTEITEQKAAKDEIKYLAFYDPLTDLPNRRLLIDRLTQAMATSARSLMHGALFFIDVDNFKSVNDTKGHAMGDNLLQQIAKRICTCMREGDTVSRFGGDEFAVMLINLSADGEEATALAQFIGNKILNTFNQPFQLINSEQYCTASIGVTLFTGHQFPIDELLKQADIAMYQAKTAGRNTMLFFDPAMQAAVTAYALLQAELHNSFSAPQLVCHFQAQINQQGDIIGAEVLIRWQHPDRGLIMPMNFIPQAEESDLIVSIGQWVLETACTQLKQWSDQPNTRHLQLAVNVSPRQFRQSDFVQRVLSALNKVGANPGNLQLELTEGLVLDNIEDTILKINTLRVYGVTFAMDDFGTGYSSLSYLTRLAFDQLKIDQSFVRNIGINTSDAVIVQTIIGMAKNLGMEVIAEGVETSEQYVFLEQHGCQLYQGYLFSKPVALESFEQLLLAESIQQNKYR